MRKFLSRVFVLAGMLAVAACGGGGDSKFETPGGGGGGGGTGSVATLSVSTTTASIPSDGSATATITALAKDANNNAMSGVAVTFSSDGGSLMVTQATTDATGTATATLSATGMAAGSTIAVTASGGGATGNVNVAVANTQQTITLATDLPQIPSDGSKQATITAFVRGANNQLLQGVPVSFTADAGGVQITRGVTDATGTATAVLITTGDRTNRRITVTGTAGSSNGTVAVDVAGTRLTVAGPTSLVQGASALYNVSLVDSGNNGIPGSTVTVSSAKANGLNPATGLVTDASGHATFTLTATNAGAETLTLGALGMTARQNVAVSNDNFAFTAPAENSKINLGAAQNVTIKWSTGGVAQQNKQISFTTTRGSITSQATTDANGEATVTVSSTTAGPAIITASATGVSAQLHVSFIATVPNAIALQASPNTIPTQGTSTIIATVRDPAQNLVEGQTVNFQLTDVTGGSLSLASAVTDAQGTAQTVYTASSTPSAAGGVLVAATVQGTAVTTSTNLTVGGQTVFISLVTGNKLSENNTKTQFKLPYSVMAIDTAGNPVNGVSVSLTAHSLQYRKGYWDNTIDTTKWIPVDTATCDNEDKDLNGVFNLPVDFDENTDGVLTPGDRAVVSPGSVVTAGNGSADFTVDYGQNYAHWVAIQLTAKATVQGTESSTSASFWLPMLATYIDDEKTSIPGEFSPFGQAAVCSDKN